MSRTVTPGTRSGSTFTSSSPVGKIATPSEPTSGGGCSVPPTGSYARWGDTSRCTPPTARLPSQFRRTHSFLSGVSCRRPRPPRPVARPCRSRPAPPPAARLRSSRCRPPVPAAAPAAARAAPGTGSSAPSRFTARSPAAELGLVRDRSPLPQRGKRPGGHSGIPQRRGRHTGQPADRIVAARGHGPPRRRHRHQQHRRVHDRCRRRSQRGPHRMPPAAVPSGPASGSAPRSLWASSTARTSSR